MRQRVDSLKKDLSDHVENIVLLDVTESTHAMAVKLITDMDEEDQELGSTLIIANRQDKGRGRGERSWESPKGGLYLSWLKSGVDPETTAKLPMLAAAAARTALSSLGVSGIQIKWPNDILVDGRKLAGILIFARHGETAWVTVGLGVNLESAPLIDEPEALPAVSVADLIGAGRIDDWRHDLCRSFISELARLMVDPAAGLESWRRHLIHQTGDTVSVRLASGTVVTGSLVEITPEGFFRIAEDCGEKVVTGGDIVES